MSKYVPDPWDIEPPSGDYNPYEDPYVPSPYDAGTAHSTPGDPENSPQPVGTSPVTIYEVPAPINTTPAPTTTPTTTTGTTTTTTTPPVTGGSNTTTTPKVGGSGGAGGGTAGFTFNGTDPSNLTWTEPGATPVYTAPVWDKPPEFHYDKQFEAPDAAKMALDPGYQFRLQQGQKALEMSAAAKGLLRSGGTLTDLINYGSNLASQEYANVYNRNWNEYKFDYDKEADIYTKNYNLSKDAFSFLSHGKEQEFAPQMTAWQVNTNNKARAQEAIFNRDWNKYLSDRDYALAVRRLEQGDVGL